MVLYLFERLHLITSQVMSSRKDVHGGHGAKLKPIVQAGMMGSGIPLLQRYALARNASRSDVGGRSITDTCRRPIKRSAKGESFAEPIRRSSGQDVERHQCFAPNRTTNDTRIVHHILALFMCPLTDSAVTEHRPPLMPEGLHRQGNPYRRHAGYYRE